MELACRLIRLPLGVVRDELSQQYDRTKQHVDIENVQEESDQGRDNNYAWQDVPCVRGHLLSVVLV